MVATVPLVASAAVPAAELAQTHEGLVHDARRRSLLALRRVERYGPAGPAAQRPRGARRRGSRGARRMIITVTLNTAIDKTLSVPNFRLGRRHRTVEQTTMPGGKGVNVARVLKTLGAPVIATGLPAARPARASSTSSRSCRCSATSCASARSRAPTPR